MLGTCFGGDLGVGFIEDLGVAGAGVLGGDFTVLEGGVTTGFAATSGSGGRGAFVVSRVE